MTTRSTPNTMREPLKSGAWSLAEVEELYRRLCDGQDVPDIASAMCRSEGSVRNTVTKRGFTLADPAIRDGYIRRRWGEASAALLAGWLHIPEAEVREHAERLGLPEDDQPTAPHRRRGPTAEERKARIQWAFDNRKTDPEAALVWRQLADSATRSTPMPTGAR